MELVLPAKSASAYVVFEMIFPTRDWQFDMQFSVIRSHCSLGNECYKTATLILKAAEFLRIGIWVSRYNCEHMSAAMEGGLVWILLDPVDIWQGKKPIQIS